MFTRRLGKPGLLVALLAVSITLATGCGKETVPSTPPLVVSTNPASGATGVLINQVVSATFSEPMNPTSITGSTFTLTAAGGVSVAGTVAYTATGSVATFTPTAPLAFGALYTATITTGATDTSGYSLAANFVWTFTTNTRPTVIVTIPVNGATGVPVNQVLSATFSKALNCATVTAASFVVTGAGGTAVAGTVSCAGAVATFTSAAVLATNTLFNATLT